MFNSVEELNGLRVSRSSSVGGFLEERREDCLPWIISGSVISLAC